jgi:hypothetical protein
MQSTFLIGITPKKNLVANGGAKNLSNVLIND